MKNNSLEMPGCCSELDLVMLYVFKQEIVQRTDITTAIRQPYRNKQNTVRRNVFLSNPNVGYGNCFMKRNFGLRFARDTYYIRSRPPINDDLD
jgi:hypothetical protein